MRNRRRHGMNGALLFGWSTAVIFQVLLRTMRQGLGGPRD
jgi:hypothetical protein